jgi:hypothetical protein
MNDKDIAKIKSFYQKDFDMFGYNSSLTGVNWAKRSN